MKEEAECLRTALSAKDAVMEADRVKATELCTEVQLLIEAGRKESQRSEQRTSFAGTEMSQLRHEVEHLCFAVAELQHDQAVPVDSDSSNGCDPFLVCGLAGRAGQSHAQESYNDATMMPGGVANHQRRSARSTMKAGDPISPSQRFPSSNENSKMRAPEGNGDNVHACFGFTREAIEAGSAQVASQRLRNRKT